MSSTNQKQVLDIEDL